jgi:hypothetical protein
MQKILKIQAFFLFLIANVAFAQQSVTAVYRDGQCYIKTCSTPTSCNASAHPIFAESSASPIKLSRLGTSKQFASGGTHMGSTAQEVYQNLRRAYKNSKADAAELNKLWRAMGYSGFADKTFTVNEVQAPEFFPAGTTGMIGNAKNTYQFAEFGNSFEGFRIKAATGCDIFIMKNCGNAFHSRTSSIFGYNNCTETLCSSSAPAPQCISQTLSGTANASQAIDGSFNGTQEIRILVRNQGEKDKGAVLCIGKAVVPYNASYTLMVDGNAVASQTVKVCPDNTNQIIPITLSLKKGLVKDNKVTFGADGRAYIDVNQKQFNALGKVFEKCCPNDCAPAK